MINAMICLSAADHTWERCPVSFGDPIDVEAVTLGSYAARSGLAAVDFIWASIQGAERDMIRGAQRLLRTTRYLYTDFSDDGTYKGEPSLSEILGLLTASSSYLRILVAQSM
jgi:hypothetical protein